jgi:hypothetical protein
VYTEDAQCCAQTRHDSMQSRRLGVHLVNPVFPGAAPG